MCRIYSQSKRNFNWDILEAYKKFKIVWTDIHKSPAHIMRRNALSSMIPPCFGYRKNTTMAIIAILRSFQTMVEIRLNSIFIFACISARIEEFMRENKVKTPMIAIDWSDRSELYPGKNVAMRSESPMILTQSIARRVITFPIIFNSSLALCEISRIAIVYNPKSAKKAKIPR